MTRAISPHLLRDRRGQFQTRELTSALDTEAPYRRAHRAGDGRSPLDASFAEQKRILSAATDCSTPLRGRRDAALQPPADRRRPDQGPVSAEAGACRPSMFPHQPQLPGTGRLGTLAARRLRSSPPFTSWRSRSSSDRVELPGTAARWRPGMSELHLARYSAPAGAVGGVVAGRDRCGVALAVQVSTFSDGLELLRCIIIDRVRFRICWRSSPTCGPPCLSARCCHPVADCALALDPFRVRRSPAALGAGRRCGARGLVGGGAAGGLGVVPGRQPHLEFLPLGRDRGIRTPHPRAVCPPTRRRRCACKPPPRQPAGRRPPPHIILLLDESSLTSPPRPASRSCPTTGGISCPSTRGAPAC